MKYDKNLKTIEDIIGDNHLSTSADTPIRDDAFKLSETEKINIIEEKVADILYTLGMDMTDDSLKGTPKRVAKMYVNEIFSGLNPENKPKASKFDNKYKYGEVLVEKTSHFILLVSIICFQLLVKHTLHIYQEEA